MLTSLENLELNQIKKSFFFIVFSSDDNALPHLKKIIDNKGFLVQWISKIKNLITIIATLLLTDSSILIV